LNRWGIFFGGNHVDKNKCCCLGNVAKSVNSDVFIVCSDCKDDTLTKVPVPIKLAMRMSAEEPLPKLLQNSVIQKQEEVSVNKQATKLSGLIGAVLFDFDRSLLVKNEQENLDQISRQILYKEPQ